MSDFSIAFGNIYTGVDRRSGGYLNVKNEKIKSISSFPEYDSVDGEYKDNTIVPGFVDIHTHGFGGFDSMECDPYGIANWSEKLLRYGVTGFIPTSVSASEDNILRFLESVRNAMEKKVEGSEILGSRLEGPFISPKMKGAHDLNLIRKPTKNEINRIIRSGMGTLKIVDLAPEIECSLESAKAFSFNNINVSIGHSDAKFQEVVEFSGGKNLHFTHFYNAMSNFQHREAGMVGAGLTLNNSELELICDLYHIDENAIKLAVETRGWDNLILVTDSISATGMKNGTYRLGELNVAVEDGLCTIADTKTIAGSTLTMDKAVRNLLDLHYVMEDIVRAASVNPCRFLNLNDRGTLQTGKKADFAVLNHNLEIVATFRNGKKLFSR